jgi:RNA polymerase sigma-70 factor (ECF subfamily)
LVISEERQLIRRAQKGETAAFETLVQQHASFVYNLALRTLNDAHEAEDIAQETFVRAWQALPQFQARAQFRTWLYRIVTNLCYNRLPHLKTELAALDPAEEVVLSDGRQAVERELLTAELRQQIFTAIDNLPQSYRLLVTLRHLQGLSYQEIAEVTEMPLGTVKTGIFRARQMLQERLSEWRVASGEWRVASGEWRVASSEWRVGD